MSSYVVWDTVTILIHRPGLRLYCIGDVLYGTDILQDEKCMDVFEWMELTQWLTITTWNKHLMK